MLDRGWHRRSLEREVRLASSLVLSPTKCVHKPPEGNKRFLARRRGPCRCVGGNALRPLAWTMLTPRLSYISSMLGEGEGSFSTKSAMASLGTPLGSKILSPCQPWARALIQVGGIRFNWRWAPLSIVKTSLSRSMVYTHSM